MPEERLLNLTSPQTDADFFAIGRILLTRSTCLKTQTAALIVADGDIISWGVNMCCPQNQIYGLPVSECPRLNAPTGTQYELCKPIHAEIVAAINALGVSHTERKKLWHFPGFTLKLYHYAGFFKNKNAVLYLLGHYWACQECIDFLKMLGISNIKFDNLSGGKTLQDYRVRDLTGGDHAMDVSGCIVAGVVTVTIAPEELEKFCERHGVNPAEIRTLPTIPKEAGGFYLIPVSVGDEITTAQAFGGDPAIGEVHILYSVVAV